MMPCGSEDLTFLQCLQKVFGSIGNGDESGHCRNLEAKPTYLRGTRITVASFAVIIFDGVNSPVDLVNQPKPVAAFHLGYI